MVPLHPWIQPTTGHVVLFTMEKSVYKSICAVQTYIVQGSNLCGIKLQTVKQPMGQRKKILQGKLENTWR